MAGRFSDERNTKKGTPKINRNPHMNNNISNAKNGQQRGRIMRQPSSAANTPDTNGGNIIRQPVMGQPPRQNGQHTPNVSGGRGRNVGARMDISDQTPSRRRSVKETKRLNPDSPEIQRSAKRAGGYKVNTKKKKGLDPTFVIYAMLFLIIFAVVSGLCVLVVLIDLNATQPPEFEYLRLKLCLEHEANDVKAVSVDTDKYVRDDILYVNMSAVSRTFGFVVTGDRKELRFIPEVDGGESVSFITGTPFARINGTTVRLEGNIFLEDDGSIFVPLSFITDYVTGIKTELDKDKNTLSVLRESKRNDGGRLVETDIEFKLKAVKDSPSISEFELSDEIKDKCYFPTISPVIPVPAA